jgi:DNA polymerase type B, organellar and viral.
LLAYVCEPRPWINQVIVISHNANVFDLHFILNRAVFLKWLPEHIMSGQKILCMKFEQPKFIDSICFLPFPLHKLSRAFGLTTSKSWYPYYFNTEENMNYAGSIPDVTYYGVDETSATERTVSRVVRVSGL